MFEINRKDETQPVPDAETRRAPEPPGPGAQTRSPSGGIAVIGRSISIDGDLRGEEDLRVEGDITGTIQLPNNSLTIGREGRIKADAYAKSVTVDGEITGDLYGSECVSIRATARVQGNVIASRVTLEEGARFKGSIDMDPESVEAALGPKREAHGATGDRQKTGKKVSTKPGPSTVPKAAADEQLEADPAH